MGTDNGPVLQFSLLSPLRQQQYHLTTEESAPVFVGHSASVRCLSASVCGTLLLSGSLDCSVKVCTVVKPQFSHFLTLCVTMNPNSQVIDCSHQTLCTSVHLIYPSFHCFIIFLDTYVKRAMFYF